MEDMGYYVHQAEGRGGIRSSSRNEFDVFKEQTEGL